MDEREGLGRDELERQEGELLPDRENMSILDDPTSPPLFPGDMPQDPASQLPPPVDVPPEE